MCKYAGVVLYEGLIEEIRTFEEVAHALAYVIERRHEYGMDETADSLIWDTISQLPVRVAGTRVCNQ